MRKITEIIVHCSATMAGQHITVADIDRWHRQRGWKGIGYHWVVYLDGTVHPGRPEAEVGAHCKGHNTHSIGVCYIGGASLPALPQRGEGCLNGKGDRMKEAVCIPTDTRTPAQKEGLLRLLKELKQRYPRALILSHHTLNPRKACPSFDATKEYLTLTAQTNSPNTGDAA